MATDSYYPKKYFFIKCGNVLWGNRNSISGVINKNMASWQNLPPPALGKIGLNQINHSHHASLESLLTINELLNKMSKLGLKIAIDDFGTGYSSFAYLQQLPIDVVKIDRSFVSTVQSSHTSHSVVKAIVSLAHTLEMQCLAEGIEQADQESTLIDLGVELAQGYRYHRPLSLSEAFAVAQC